MQIDFFHFRHLIIPEDYPKDLGAKLYDRTHNHGAEKAIQAVADKFEMSYDDARAKLIQCWQNQRTFSMYGICCAAVRGDGGAVGRFLKGVVQCR